MQTNVHFYVLIALWGYTVMCIIALYTSNYYEDKCFTSLFAQFKHKAKIYACKFTYFIINKHK